MHGPRSIRRGIRQHASAEGEIGAQPLERQRAREELGIRGRDEEALRVPLIQHLAALEIHRLDAPESVRPRQHLVDLFRQRSGMHGNHDGRQQRREADPAAPDPQSPIPHFPVTFDSSQISSSSPITMKVPTSGMPSTTPTPKRAAAYPSVAGASRPPNKAREKIPLKNPGW